MQKQGRMSRFEFVNVFVSLSGRATRKQPCPLRQRCRAATSPRGRGSGVTGRPTLDEQSLRWPETVVPCYRDSRQLDKVRCPEAAALCSSARPFAPRRAFSGQAKVARLANGSPFGGNSDDRRQWRKQGGVVGAAASKTQAKRCGCWVPQPGLGERSETERALRLPLDTPSTTPISPSSIMRLVPPEEKKGSEMPVLGMVLVTTATFSTACRAPAPRTPPPAAPRTGRARGLRW